MFEFTMTDNPEPYKGYDLMDQACFSANNSQGLAEKVCIPNLYFFSVNATDRSNDLGDIDFQGYIGLVPDLLKDSGMYDRNRPALITQLQERGLIGDPVVGINLK